MGERNPVTASGLWWWSGSGSKVNQFIPLSRHLSTRDILCTSMHAFLSNLAHRQTDRQTDKRTRACGQKHIPPPLSAVNNEQSSYTVTGCQESKFAHQSWLPIQPVSATTASPGYPARQRSPCVGRGLRGAHFVQHSEEARGQSNQKGTQWSACISDKGVSTGHCLRE